MSKQGCLNRIAKHKFYNNKKLLAKEEKFYKDNYEVEEVKKEVKAKK